ncbi:MAG: 16S rRNA (guanine(527)-N(7))-methyltransferase RsmG [Angelakisella sp.]|jgi:16S rRNA (guanine527-N7)-methyltransferase|nr:16S rRNA (guanine(527)-N(7))-methyltransferase RsmG [Angelakisella sp.]MCI9529957.1 16S rRNA (guanine(527)-N(7))-methyltransferase RsmG [Angelakisella sp.]
MIPKEAFEAMLAEAGLAGEYQPFARYCGMLQEWNQRMNLTAITDDQGVAEKHFLDSLLPLTLWELPRGARLVDVGTGAGFPAVPIKLLRPDIQITLLDSLQKRLTFLEEVCGQLGIQAELLHARAEDAGRDPARRERYDVATSRAVAGMDLLAEYCLPLVRPGGVLLALKGSGGAAESQAGAAMVERCGGTLRAVKEYALPSGDRRTLVVVEKTAPTPKRYPRTPAQLAKAKKEAAGQK